MQDKKCYKCGSSENIRPVNKSNLAWNTCICKECHNLKARLYNDKHKLLVFEHYGKLCVCCGEDTFEFLSIDHINNDGHKDVNSNGVRPSGKRLYPKIVRLNFPTYYQVLCMNCNFGKRMNNGVCPHKTVDT